MYEQINPLVDDSDPQVIVCQHCGSNYTHHFRTEIYDRTNDDEPTGSHVTVGRKNWGDIEPQTIRADGDMGNNPSKRRDGIVITITCEDCNSDTEICISQHKGLTVIHSRAVAHSIL